MNIPTLSSHRAAILDRDAAFGQALAAHAATVGNTPLFGLAVWVGGHRAPIALKLEKCNPTGSSKDRTACELVAEALANGRLREDSVLLESTSGNLGVALAHIASVLGVGFEAVVDPCVSLENVRRMCALGARVECVSEHDDQGGYLLTRLYRIRERLARDADRRLVWTDQYSSPSNPRAHYFGTAQELYVQMEGRVDAVLAPVSTGGTVAGISRYFRENSPATVVIAVDVPGSVAVRATWGKRVLSGIGASRGSDFLTGGDYDDVAIVPPGDAIRACRGVYAATGLLLGPSSGATIVAAARYLGASGGRSRVVCVCPDGGENYQSTAYDDAWTAAAGLGRCDEVPPPVERFDSDETYGPHKEDA